jgi:hypothetical protein
MTEVLKGGKGDNRSLKDFDKEQIQMGLDVEMEHTSTPSIALEIVLDHLSENPEYYTYLKDMEKSFGKNSFHLNKSSWDNILRAVKGK